MVASEPTAFVACEVYGPEDDETQAVGGNKLLAAFVVELALVTSMNAGDREAIRLVEVGDGLVVLALPVLDDDSVIGVVGVERKADTNAGPAGVSEEPVKTVLPSTLLVEYLVAKFDDVRLVA